jgi:hypothetical protein
MLNNQYSFVLVEKETLDFFSDFLAENALLFYSSADIIGAALGKALTEENTTVFLSEDTLLKHFPLISTSFAPLFHHSHGEDHLNICFVCCSGERSLIREKMLMIPGVRLWNCAFKEEFPTYLRYAQSQKGPVFLFPPRYSNSNVCEVPMQGAVIRHYGEHLTLVTTGEGVSLLMGFKDYFAENGITYDLIDVACLYPFNPAPVLQSLYRTGRLGVVDVADTGLAEMVALNVWEKVLPQRQFSFFSSVLPYFDSSYKEDFKKQLLEKVRTFLQN